MEYTDTAAPSHSFIVYREAVRSDGDFGLLGPNVGNACHAAEVGSFFDGPEVSPAFCILIGGFGADGDVKIGVQIYFALEITNKLWRSSTFYIYSGQVVLSVYHISIHALYIDSND